VNRGLYNLSKVSWQQYEISDMELEIERVSVTKDNNNNKEAEKK